MILLIVIGYIAMWTLTWSAMLADFQSASMDVCGNGKWTDEAIRMANQFYRRDLRISVILALFPPTWIAAIFVTGFYEQGLQFGRRK